MSGRAFELLDDMVERRYQSDLRHAARAKLLRDALIKIAIAPTVEEANRIAADAVLAEAERFTLSTTR